MNFGAALDLITAGHRVARQGWNGKGMFIYLVPAASYPAQRGAAKRWLGEGAMVPYDAYIAMKTAQDRVVPWLASQNDILAADWLSIEEEPIFTPKVDVTIEFKRDDMPACPAGAQCLSLRCKLDHSPGACGQTHNHHCGSFDCKTCFPDQQA
jgi:hypothetical protein